MRCVLRRGGCRGNAPDAACLHAPRARRWYRAPECLLTDGYYNYKMDMWGVGCVFFEIVSLFPLFPGTNELDQIQKIHSILGTPAPELLAKMKKRSAHMDFNFPPKVGGGCALRLHPPPASRGWPSV